MKLLCVISNKNCNALKKAEKNNISSYCIDNFDKTREEFDKTVADIVDSYSPDLVVLAGFMRVLTEKFIGRFENIINLHPALQTSFRS